MKKRLAGMVLLALSLLIMCAGYVHADFVEKGGNTYYQDEDGTYLTGLQTIDDKMYFFDANGVMKKKAWVKTPDGNEYRASKSGVILQNKWFKKKYYLNEEGEKAFGLTKIGKKLYFFAPDTGLLQTGKLKDEEGNLYITNKKGVVYSGKFFKYEKSNYYAFPDGKLAKGLVKVGLYQYFFKKSNGKMVTGKKKKVGGYYYYFTKAGPAACEKWVKLDGKYYYFQQDGRMATNMYIGTKWYVDAEGVRKSASLVKMTVTEKDGKRYIYDEIGNLQTAKWTNIDGKTYYSGTDGVLVTGLQTIENVQYCFGEDGALLKNTVTSINGTMYQIDEEGKVTGTTDASGAAMAKYAQQFVGNPYVYGGTSLTKGADCSGFCYSVHQKFGIQLMRVADDQMKGPNAAYQKLGYKKGMVIKDADLLPGDLVFYGSSSYASHVAMYIGNNKIVHAANSRLGIIISDMDYVKSRVKDHNMRYWA